MNSILIYAAIALGGVAVGWLVSWFVESRKAVKSTQQAEQIIKSAKKEAADVVRDGQLEAKDTILKGRNELAREIREAKSDQSQIERRLQQRQSQMDKRIEQVEQRDREFQGKEKEVKRLADKATEAASRYDALLQDQLKKLESIAVMTQSEAKEELKTRLLDQARNESGILMKKIEEEATTEANRKAQKIIGLAIQRCAADTVAESSVSVVALSGDEMKGRIIGREGRNIKAIEQATGVDLIIDDTPEAVILSSFDPIKREVARLSLERLVTDGRIHPARIEDVVNKVKKDVERTIIEAGEKAVMEVGCDAVHPEILRLLGRLKFRTSYSQNVLLHSVEVAFLCGMMASELGLDPKVARRAGLLHDIGKAVTHEIEGPHAAIGADFARRYNEKPIIINAIASHHEDVEAESVTATLVAAADSLSASRPGARIEMLEAYVKRLEQLEGIANSFKGVDKTFVMQAGREIRVSVIPETISDGATYLLAKDIAKKIESEMAYPGEIKVTVIRETRVTETAK
ncbi:MAG: ribonuclease Y [Nitrospinae bacterium]|nr:ribonuclease Y [Nitrospinota bacterium]